MTDQQLSDCGHPQSKEHHREFLKAPEERRMDFRQAECRLSVGGSDLLLLLLNAEPARHPRRAGSIAKKDYPMSALRELEEMIRRLLEAARKLPAGETRHSTLKEIGRLRVRLDAISAQQSQSAK